MGRLCIIIGGVLFLFSSSVAVCLIGVALLLLGVAAVNTEFRR